MADAEPQNFANHRRYDPWYHVFIFLVASITFLYSLWVAFRAPGIASAWQVIWNAAFIVLVFKVRLYALKVQDRVIRLEEGLRLASLLPAPLKSRIGELSERQLISLRFASDAEVAGLVQAALDEKLGGEEIKKRIKNWRPDTFRV